MADKNPIFYNRELSWLEFDKRCLSEAKDKTIPLFERIKFLSITASNLDEFFMVRIASLTDMVHAGYTKKDIAGMTPQEQLDALHVSSSTDDPCIVMCEYSGILLVSAWVCRNLTILDVILCECWVVEYKSVLCIESLVDRSKSLLVAALILADVRHDSKSLWLDEDLAFLALLRSHLLTICIVSSEEPVAVPC